MEPNIAFACLTRFCQAGQGENEAVRWVSPDFTVESLSYAFFEQQSNRIAWVLQNLGLEPGQVASIYLPRSPELISSFFAILKLRAISCVLFSTLGEEALRDRLENSASRVVITRKSLLRKILTIRPQLPALQAILLVDGDENRNDGVFSLPRLMASASPVFEYPPLLEAETPAFLQYTSGSTGRPKGALHVHGALADMRQSFEEVMQLEPGDRYWCTADPAWITGLVYGMIAPFAEGTQQSQFSGGYNARAWLSFLEQQSVNVWYTAPTALRMLMQEEPAVFQQHSHAALKRMYSVGEPLNPEIYAWGKRTFGVEVYDTWFQSETGSIMVANRPGLVVKPGSMGLPRSGVEVAILDSSMDELPPGCQGLLTLRRGWQSMFRTYYHREVEYAEKFHNEMYLTGDLARKDEDGYIWYVSRADDVINTAGHLVGPFEVESALLEIPEITDVAVIGVDDPLLHQKIIAYVTLAGSTSWYRELELKCRIHVSNKVSSTAIPAEFRVIDRVPKNQSGKILRRVLKALYEGRDPGDLSTMEQQ